MLVEGLVVALTELLVIRRPAEVRFFVDRTLLYDGRFVDIRGRTGGLMCPHYHGVRSVDVLITLLCRVASGRQTNHVAKRDLICAQDQPISD